jgi:hypothetical protein
MPLFVSWKPPEQEFHEEEGYRDSVSYRIAASSRKKNRAERIVCYRPLGDLDLTRNRNPTIARDHGTGVLLFHAIVERMEKVHVSEKTSHCAGRVDMLVEHRVLRVLGPVV